VIWIAGEYKSFDFQQFREKLSNNSINGEKEENKGMDSGFT
jgi:hypothetical protein